MKERNAVAWRHGGINPFTRCVEHRLRREEKATKLHSATAVLKMLPVIRGANHKGAAAATVAEPADNVAVSDGCKANDHMSLKDLFSLKGGVTGD